jgi:hypothetical protein
MQSWIFFLRHSLDSSCEISGVGTFIRSEPCRAPATPSSPTTGRARQPWPIPLRHDYVQRSPPQPFTIKAGDLSRMAATGSVTGLRAVLQYHTELKLPAALWSEEQRSGSGERECHSLLHVACCNQQLAVVKFLIEEVGVDVNQLTDGNCALHHYSRLMCALVAGRCVWVLLQSPLHHGA